MMINMIELPMEEMAAYKIRWVISTKICTQWEKIKLKCYILKKKLSKNGFINRFDKNDERTIYVIIGWYKLAPIK